MSNASAAAEVLWSLKQKHRQYLAVFLVEP
jgi:hypothetical protein